ncbi:sodium:proton exchanger [Candidatus Pacearchaeota archaeon CG_4_9_14_0_2_um_filter_39_13]|nr:sodium:proton exchanger [Candidatus Pacearchaeota archaeon]OIO44380.1 MAG: hypothetical protein AUJ64_00170 [Candidatus Pacearchaeota archaeon CG1_02_39_14]PJC44601.1 MAG: sodium:proton exchanger [Candidatus Pacearchaeota archaeon CG_4_9_14_0_2_um_filter_39_13]
MVEINLFVELGMIIVLAVIISGIMKIFRQPLIIGYIVTGIVAGPYFLDLITSSETISTFSQIGITFLLFIVGISLNPRVIREVGPISLLTGVGQVIFTAVVGYFISILLGFSPLVSIYIAVALTFSSTIIITKILSDKGDVETLYGKISIGFLIVQDLIAVLVLMALSSFSTDVSLQGLFVGTILKGIFLIAVVLFASILVLPRAMKPIAKSQEFLLLFSVGWCFAVAGIFYWFNFSMEMGALLAGMALSISPYRYEISSKMTPLRDFFIVLFFIWLGSQIIFVDLSSYALPIVIFSLLILIGNPFIVMVIMGFSRYTKRNSFFAGLTVAQIGEFSMILMAMGVSLGHISNEILSLVTVIGLITLAGSTYFINYNDKLYHILAGPLGLFERRRNKADYKSEIEKRRTYDIILFGYNRIGFNLLKTFRKAKKRVLVIDYNPSTISDLSARGISCLYGDAHDPDFLNSLNLSEVKLAVSTIPDKHVNLFILGHLRAQKIPFIVTSHDIEDSLELYKAGAVYVVMPHFLGGEYISHLLEKHDFDTGKLLDEGKSHISDLAERQMEGHSHPKKGEFGN